MNRRQCLAALSTFAVTAPLLARDSVVNAGQASATKAQSKKAQPALIDQKKCIHCGTCFKSCPVKAIGKQTVKGVDVYTVNPVTCISCGTCIKNCPVKAIAWAGAAKGSADSTAAKTGKKQ